MLKVLIKKQLNELLRGFLISQKKNKARTKSQTIGYIAFYVLLVYGVMGGFFVFFAHSTCSPLFSVDLGWMYFPFFGFFTILLGFFCSVFATPGMLYHAKDNDLVLSMPISFRDIIISRFVAIAVMAVSFSIPVYLPAMIVYFIVQPFTLSALICQLVGFIFTVSLALLLCTLIGMAIAKLSTMIRSKSIISLVGTALFLVVYFYFIDAIQDFMADVAQGAINLANGLNALSSIFQKYGEMCLGNMGSMFIFLGVSILILGLCIYLVSIGFLKLATSAPAQKKVKKGIKKDNLKSIDMAVLGKEKDRLFASTNYLLNCCLGGIFIPAFGIYILVKGSMVRELAEDITGGDMGLIAVVFTAAICMFSALIDTAAPSVSLEGKTHWISQTLPVEPWKLLKGKLNLELILSVSTTLFAQICLIIALRPDLVNTLLILIVPQSYVVFSAVFNLLLSIRFANYEWTNEVFPIKQSAGVVIGLFSGWGYAAVLIAIYLIFNISNETAYLAIWCIATICATYLLLKRIQGKGTLEYLES
ncbi:MAG: hypothetical protein MJ146_02820 [Clostridia bacterium]|nr:hypothetical protein [Clostridia bacterium]